MSYFRKKPRAHLACRLRFGLADWREVESIGIRAIREGHAEPEVVALATVTEGSGELQQLVEAALLALGSQVPGELEAAKVVVADWADKISERTIDPIYGARELWRLARDVPNLESDLAVFIGLASEWQDDPNHRDAYAQDIVDAALRLAEDYRES